MNIFNKKAKLLFFMLPFLFVCSCKEDSGISDNEMIKNTITPFGGSALGLGYDLMLDYDKPNLVGLVKVEAIKQNEYVFDDYGNFTTYSGTSYELSAQISNPQRTQLVSLIPGNIVVNAYQMMEYADGKYYVPSSLNAENYFGGGYNKILIDSNQYFNTLIDSVTFGDIITITNLSLGHTINRNQNLVINYTGASSNSLVEVFLNRLDRFS